MKSTPETDTLPRWLQWGVFGVLGVILVLMPFHAFLSTWAGSVFGGIELWKSWKELLLVLASAPLVVWLTLKPSRWRVLFKDPLAWWLVAFIVVLGFVSLLHFHDNGVSATMAGLAMTGRYLLIFALAYTLFLYGSWNWPEIRRYAAGYLVGIGLFISLLGIIQVQLLPNDFLVQFGYNKETTIAPYTLIDENPEAPRAFATLRGPNDFGAFLILPLLLTLIAAWRNKWWLIGSGVILFALFESASRSAWLGAVAAIIALLVMTYGRKIITSRKGQIGLVGVVALAIVVAVAAVSIPSVRLEIFHSSPDDSSLTEGSTDNHWSATAGGIQRVLANPLGCGAGCAGPASYYGEHPKISENYYVQIAEETGISGLILWIGIAVMVVQRLWKRRDDYLARALLAAFVGISVIGFLLHVWADDPLSLTWWLLSGITLGYYAQVGYDKRKFITKNTNNDRKKAKKTTQARR